MTNKEIAKKLNISEATLSFIINNKPRIARKTRERVIRELNDLGYGHILKKSTTVLSKNICFVVYKRHGHVLNQSPFFMLLMEHIDARARASGFNLLVKMIDASHAVDDQIHAFDALDISGIVIFATEMLDDDMMRFRKLSKPIVSLDNDFTHLGIDSVVINNKVGTLQAVKHLVELGHKKIGYLQCKTYTNSLREREEGYRKALGYFGLDLAKRHVFRLGFTEEESYQEFMGILAAGAELPTAFVSDIDTISVGVLRALNDYNIRIPEEVSLVGFDDRPISQLTRPQLTSVSVPKGRFGSQAVNLLVDRLANPAEDSSDYRRVEVGVQLVIRGSTGNLCREKVVGVGHADTL